MSCSAHQKAYLPAMKARHDSELGQHPDSTLLQVHLHAFADLNQTTCDTVSRRALLL
jgi:hypothetical protein